MTQTDYADNYRALVNRIEQLGKDYKKKIKLVAVSKNQDYKKVLMLSKLGQRDFGENYVDEAYEKINSVSDSSIRWHFIGRIQSNKINKICNLFDWVQTISSEKHLNKINDACKTINKVMNICIQINIDHEDSKSGIQIEDYEKLSKKARALECVKLRGIMTIPKVGISTDDAFAKMNTLYVKHDYLDTLSMGMSSDFLSAIENGANMLRIGQEIFGKRT